MFIAYAIGKNDGCDYTMACNQILWKLEANNWEDAKKELKHKLIGEWMPEYKEFEEGYWDSCEIGKLTLYELSLAPPLEIPLADWYNEARQQSKSSTVCFEENKEMGEFERLKAKYG